MTTSPLVPGAECIEGRFSKANICNSIHVMTPEQSFTLPPSFLKTKSRTPKKPSEATTAPRTPNGSSQASDNITIDPLEVGVLEEGVIHQRNPEEYPHTPLLSLALRKESPSAGTTESSQNEDFKTSKAARKSHPSR